LTKKRYNPYSEIFPLVTIPNVLSTYGYCLVYKPIIQRLTTLYNAPSIVTAMHPRENTLI